MLQYLPRRLWLASLLLAACTAATAQDLPYEPVSSGFRFAANTVLLDPAPSPRAFQAGPPEGVERTLAEEAARLSNHPATRAALLSRNGRIFFEYHVRGVTPTSTPLAYSMSKSLVALTVGRALCDGSFRSLDDPAKSHAPQLAGTNYGEATLRQLLTMSSGASPASFLTGHPDPEESFVLRNMYQPRGLDVDPVERMKRYTGHAQPGSGFNYNNYDTQALVYAIEGATKTDFASYFERTVWRSIAAEHPGAWLRNHQRTVIGWAGFSAAPRDYLRIGHMLVDEMRQPDTCYARYLKEATQPHVTPAAGRAYGYQIHKLSMNLAPESFWFLGFGGQTLAVDVPSGTVAYLYQGNTAQWMAWVREIAAFMGQARQP